MKTPVSHSIATAFAAAALLFAPHSAKALSPQTRADERVIEQSVFTPLSSLIQTDETGTATAIGNPFGLDHFTMNINGKDWNPPDLVLEAYRRALDRFGIRPEDSAMFMKIQGSAVYSGSTRHASDIDMMLGNTEQDVPLEDFKPVFTDELRRLLDETLDSDAKAVFIFYEDEDGPEIQALDIDLFLPDKNGPRLFQLNFVFVDRGPAFFAEQKKNLLLKCFFDAAGRAARLDGIVGEHEITRQMLEKEADAIFKSARLLAQKAFIALSAPADKPFEEIVTARHMFAIKERYIAWNNLVRQKNRFRNTTFNHSDPHMDNADPGLRAYAMEFFRGKLAKKVLEAAVIAGDSKTAAQTLAMMDEGRFDMGFLATAAQGLFGADWEGRPEKFGIVSHQIRAAVPAAGTNADCAAAA